MNQRILKLEITHPIFDQPIARTFPVSKDDFALSKEWLMEKVQEVVREEARKHYLWTMQEEATWFSFKANLWDAKGPLAGTLQAFVTDSFT